MRARYFVGAALALMPVAASASEKITYTYDAKGRLTKVQHAGGPADRLTATYTFDTADNRTGSQVTNAPGHVVIVPLSGLRLIPTS